jgi:hypothetical protein
MEVLPKFAISIRQPWAHAIVHLGKTLENRDWSGSNPGKRFRGPVCIHAAKGMTRGEYESALHFMRSIGADCPAPHYLLRGGIIGTADVVDHITGSSSPWFMGPGALVLNNVKPCDFVGCAGQLGFFKWEPSGLGPMPPNPWMDPTLVKRHQPASGQQEYLL